MNPFDQDQTFPPLRLVENASPPDDADLIEVELVTSTGCVWRGSVSSAGILLNAGTLDLISPSEAYLHFPSHTTLRLRTGAEMLAFQLEEAAASIQTGKLTVLAKTILRCTEPESD